MLPPTLLASLKHIGTPIRTPTGTMSPVEGYKQFLPPVSNVSFQSPVANVPVAAPLVAQQQQQQFQQPQMLPQPMMQNQMMMNQPMAMQPQQISPEMLAHQQPMMMMQPQMMVQPQQIISPQPMAPQPIAPIIPITGTILSSQPLMMSNNIQSMTPAQVVPATKPPLIDQLSNSSLLDSLSQAQPVVVPVGKLPAAPTPTPPQSGQASRSMSFSEKAPSVPDSP